MSDIERRTRRGADPNPASHLHQFWFKAFERYQLKSWCNNSTLRMLIAQWPLATSSEVQIFYLFFAVTHVNKTEENTCE